MKNGDKLKATKNLYSSFPVKENLITDGKLYTVFRCNKDTFSVFDDTYHTRSFFSVEFNELFINFTDDIESFMRQLVACNKLNKNMEIKNYDYIIKRYKSFTMNYIDTPISFREKQFDSLTIEDRTYKASITVAELLIELGNDYGTAK